MKTSPALKYQSETENESSASRSRLRSESGRRAGRRARARKTRDRSASQTGGAVDLSCRRTRRRSRAPSSTRPAGPVHASSHGAGRVVDPPVRDLARRARPDLAPSTAAVFVVERRVGRPASAGSGRASRRPSGCARKIAIACSSSARCVAAAARTASDERPCASYAGARRGATARARGSASAQRAASSVRGATAAERSSARRNDQSLLPTKFSGVTRTIAIAWATTLPSPSADEQLQDEQVRAERDERDDEEAQPLVGDVAALAAERPEPVPHVVVRHRDEEGADRGEEVVDAEPRGRAASRRRG